MRAISFELALFAGMARSYAADCRVKTAAPARR